MHASNTQITRKTEERVVITEQPVQRICCGQHEHIGRSAQGLIPRDNGGSAGVLALCVYVQQQWAQVGDIPGAQVEPLT